MVQGKNPIGANATIGHLLVPLPEEFHARVLAKITYSPRGGLTIEEAIEFDALDALPPFDDNGEMGWLFQGEPVSPREKRWLELYVKLNAGGLL